jgi:type I restriction enzyme S subunit
MSSTAYWSRRRVPSIDRLAPGWVWAQIGELASPTDENAITDGPFGSNLKTSHYTSDGPRVIRLQNIGEGEFHDAQAHISWDHYERLAKHRVYAGDLVIAALGEHLPRACVVPANLGPAIVKADCIRFNPDPQVATPEFLNWMLNADPTQKLTAATIHGVGRPRLNMSDIRSIPVPVAPLPEQRRVVAAIEERFTRLNDAVASLKRVQANLKRYRASMLNAACEARLVPTEAELARTECRGYEPAEQFLDRIQPVRKSDDLTLVGHDRRAPRDGVARPHAVSLLPEGWVRTSLRELKAFSLYGPRFSSGDYAEHGYLVLRTSDISDSGRVNTSAAPRLPLAPSEFGKYKVERGDLLITRTGSLGTLAVFNDDVQAIPGAYLIQYRLDAPLETSWYIFYFLKSPKGQKHLFQGGAGVGRPNLNAPTIEAISIPLPPLAEQQRIVAEIERRLSVVEELESSVAANLKRAKRLRQAILKRAFDGKLVPQDPLDEPASMHLDRMREDREAGAPSRSGRSPGSAKKRVRFVQGRLEV